MPRAEMLLLDMLPEVLDISFNTFVRALSFEELSRTLWTRSCSTRPLCCC
jgi:hypothetical protein